MTHEWHEGSSSRYRTVSRIKPGHLQEIIQPSRIAAKAERARQNRATPCPGKASACTANPGRCGTRTAELTTDR